MTLNPTQHADWEIAEDAETRMKPITEIAINMGLKKEEILLHGHHIAKVDFKSVLKRFEGKSDGEVRRRYSHHTDAPRGGQIDLDHWPDPGFGQARKERDRHDSPAFGRSNHEYQRLGSRRRPFAGLTSHAIFARTYRRHQRHHELS